MCLQIFHLSLIGTWQNDSWRPSMAPKVCGFLNRCQVSGWNLCFITCNGACSNVMLLLQSELAFHILRHLVGVAGIPGCSITSMHYLLYYTTILIYSYSLCAFLHWWTGNYLRVERLHVPREQKCSTQINPDTIFIFLSQEYVY